MTTFLGGSTICHKQGSTYHWAFPGLVIFNNSIKVAGRYSKIFQDCRTITQSLKLFGTFHPLFPLNQDRLQYKSFLIGSKHPFV